MRDPKTYRAFRRNEPGNFIRVDGANWKKPFDPKVTYKTPSKKERYWDRRRAKYRTQAEIEIVDDTAEAAEAAEAVAEA